MSGQASQRPDLESQPVSPVRVLVVEDNPGDADLAREALDVPPGAWQVDHVTRLSDAIAALGSRGADVVLLDLTLPDAYELQGVMELVRLYPDVPLVVLTGTTDVEAGTRAVQQGAQEYLIKGELDGRMLTRALRYAIERQAHARRARLLAYEHAARTLAEAGRRRAVLLADASVAVSSTLDEKEAMASLARVLVPRFAGCCGIERLDAEGHARCLMAYESRPGDVRELDMGTSDQAAADALRASIARGARIETQIPEPSQAWEAAPRDALRGLSLRTAIIVPLPARNEGMGVLTLCSPREYDAEDLAVAEEVASRTAAAIEACRLYTGAVDAVRLRDELIAVAGHELRTPLMSLLLDAHLLEETPDVDPEKLRSRFQRIVRGGERLQKLLGDLLDLSRIRARRFLLELTDVELGPLVRDVVERYAPELARARSELRLAERASVRGRWDRSRIEQVVANLLQNAIRYGAGRPIDITVEQRGAAASLRVRDHGRGIEARDQEHIFEQFSRVAESSRKGLGIGLYITRGIVEAHGGSISVRSQVGEGAEFHVELPCAHAAQATE